MEQTEHPAYNTSGAEGMTEDETGELLMARTPIKKKAKGRTTSTPKPVGASQSALAPKVSSGQFYGDYLAETTLREVMFGANQKDDTVSKAIVNDLLTAMAPRDPLERMLVQQLAWTHGRIRGLSRWAAGASQWEAAMAAHEHCERAMNTYRKGMVALKEYRSKPRETPLVAVQQVNNAAEGHTWVEAVPLEHRVEPASRENEKKEKT